MKQAPIEIKDELEKKQQPSDEDLTKAEELATPFLRQLMNAKADKEEKKDENGKSD